MNKDQLRHLPTHARLWFKARLRPIQIRRGKSKFAASLKPADQEFFSHVDPRISPKDGMYAGNPRHYFQVGLSAAHCIARSLDRAGSPKIRNVLDLPCGHGRVLRFIVKLLPNAAFTACDLDRDGVDFCSETFNAQPAHSTEHLETLSLGQLFDLIWCGSLVTHLDAADIRILLRAIMRHAAPGAIVIVTTHGATAAKWMAEGASGYGMKKGQIEPMLEEYERTGFAYRNYAYSTSYGISLSSPDWIRQQVREVGGLREVHFEAHGWADHQDVFAFLSV